MEAIAFMGVGHGLDKILCCKESRQKRKDGSQRASQSILTKDDEARKQLSQHMYAKIMDFDEVSSRDELIRSVLAKPHFFKEALRQINWSWSTLLVVLSLNCVPRLCTADGDAAHMRFRVVERNDVRFTHQASDVNILECVFPASDRVRKIVSEPAAGGFYVGWYLRKFIKLVAKCIGVRSEPA